jgi:uncharacterized protein (TIGR02246 family)
MTFARLSRIACAAALLASLAGPSSADPAGDVRRAYAAFAAAQNARDIARVRTLLSDAPDFLWVSDGKTFWGREAMLERMAAFQQSPVWRVEPDLDKATVVAVAADAAYLHMPLTLVIGAAERPDRLRFLVSILFQRRAGAWTIAALFTTTEKPE